MRLKNLRLKLKMIKLKRFLIRNVKKKSRKLESGKRVTWMNHVSHGYHVVELRQTWTSPNNLRKFDPVVVQREETRDCELWFFCVFDDDGVADKITKHMQSNFFNKLPKESKMGKKSKEAMKRAHLQARSKMDDRDESDAVALKSGSASASAMVINGERLVMANTGGYTAVVCRGGKAYQIGRKRQQPTSAKWPLTFISGGLHVPKIHKIVCDTTSAKNRQSSEVIVGSERVDSETEFVILASTGVWEVMRQQEAVNLIRHIEDAQAAAECLAAEALIRMSKSIISCLIIRFH